MFLPLIIGNWKLHGNKKIIKSYFTDLCSKLKLMNLHVEIAIAPPMVYLELAMRYLNQNITLCAQNVDTNIYGAFTGETSIRMLKDIGVKYVIIGHSERRLYHKESNHNIAKKFALIKEASLIPVLCIGENEQEYAIGKSEYICHQQLDSIINFVGIESFYDSIIAYEPIWAIGTGRHANPLQVQKIHQSIRDHIARYDENVAKQLRIQYGGSVNEENISQFLRQSDVSGALIGSACLKTDTFINIIKNTEAIKK
ncbi:triose-phosphate isomerase [Candidatus Schneideria nysicola]|uniref:triose-phosphate isomerase n=1 Tax=Candidatus Schneideria nysicola TaxID=1081631 RepID=UPI001CAA51CA|nr:triose-phosphate isomerase [Candidatus Schneideria nysicola]UAJ65908.1 triose-phosphate isomerase [Candidatus Schneideria nysicola]